MSLYANFFRAMIKAVPALGIAMIPGFREAYRKNPQKAMTYATVATAAIAGATLYGYHHWEKNKMGEIPEQVHTGGSHAVKPHNPR